ncbi:MAG TPA: MBL fold metallo-hydrolase [Stellaceae bacterium]|jgi:ribonuclease Z
MFDLVFLGTAAAVPSAERGLPALYVGHAPDRFLVDCGEGTQRQLLRAGLGFRGLAHVLLTHAHLDHVAGLAGLVATRALWGLGDAIEIIGSGETIDFVRRYLAVTVGEAGGGYRLRAVEPGLVLSRPGWRLDAFAVAHRGTKSLGWRFEEEARRPLLAERLAALGVPEGAVRRELAEGRAVTLADSRLIAPEMVQGPEIAGTRLVVIGDVEAVASLTDEVGGCDALVIEATFLDRDTSLARARGHLTAAAAAGLARAASIGELLLTHISGRYRPEDIAAEAAAVFPRTRVVADFDRIAVAARSRAPEIDN